MLKLKDVTPLPDEPLVLQGEFDPPVTIEKLTDKLTEVLWRVPYVVPVDSPPSIRRVAFCSGAAQDYLEKAADAGAQAYLSGEISERTVLEARELGVPYFAVGHHASEDIRDSSTIAMVSYSFSTIKCQLCEHRQPDID